MPPRRYPRILESLMIALALASLSGAAAALAASPPPTFASPVGLWAPLNARTGKPDGLIRIFERNGLYYGRIEPSSPTDDRSARCTRCTGARRNRPIIGLVIMRHLKLENGKYVGGAILDPNTGRTYGCSLRLVDGGRKLIMHGYLGLPLFGRSQTWQRMAGRPGVKVWPVGP
jgi:uncharacterized protein (DUF2147 family)